MGGGVCLVGVRFGGGGGVRDFGGGRGWDEVKCNHCVLCVLCCVLSPPGAAAASASCTERGGIFVIFFFSTTTTNDDEIVFCGKCFGVCSRDERNDGRRTQPHQRRVTVEDGHDTFHGVRGLRLCERHQRRGGAQGDAAANRIDFVVHARRRIRGVGHDDGGTSSASTSPRSLLSGQLGESGRGGGESGGHRVVGLGRDRKRD